MCEQLQATRFFTIPVPKSSATIDRSIPIGQGPCKAVRLKVNAYNRNTQALTVASNFYLYIGDQEAQETELLVIDTVGVVNVQWTPKIYVDDLSKVWVRNPNVAAFPDPAILQVMVYTDES